MKLVLLSLFDPQIIQTKFSFRKIINSTIFSLLDSCNRIYLQTINLQKNKIHYSIIYPQLEVP